MNLKQILGVSTALLVLGTGLYGYNQLYNRAFNQGVQYQKNKQALEIKAEEARKAQEPLGILVEAERLKVMIYPNESAFTAGADTNEIRDLMDRRTAEASEILGLPEEQRKDIFSLYLNHLRRVIKRIENPPKPK